MIFQAKLLMLKSLFILYGPINLQFMMILVKISKDVHMKFKKIKIEYHYQINLKIKKSNKKLL